MAYKDDLISQYNYLIKELSKLPITDWVTKLSYEARLKIVEDKLNREIEIENAINSVIYRHCNALHKLANK